MDLGGLSVAGGIHEALLFPGCADVQPLQYINGLADAIVTKYGGQIFEHSQVLKTSGKKVSLRSVAHPKHMLPDLLSPSVSRVKTPGYLHVNEPLEEPQNCRSVVGQHGQGTVTGRCHSKCLECPNAVIRVSEW